MSRNTTRRRECPAKSPALLAVLTIAAMACTATPRTEVGPGLRFPDSGSARLPASVYRATAEEAARAYVKVVVMAETATGGGREDDSTLRTVNGASGIIVDPAGYVVTAAHIAGRSDLTARVTTFDGHEHPARIVHVDAGREMALLKIRDRGTRFPAAEPGPAVRAGQSVFAIGTPDNRPGAVTAGHVTQPRVDRRIRYGRFGFQGALELAMTVEPGHSGGPVFDAAGKLLGMIVGFDLKRTGSGRTVTTGTAYAIPATDVLAFFRRATAAMGISEPAAASDSR